MFVSLKWLQDYVDIADITASELAERITRSGIEVEQVEVQNEGITGIVVGHVVERVQHPNADKLSVCQVDLGNGEPVQIVCGAKNVAAGQKVAVATVGATLPGNFKIKKAKLRGEESNGMICSLTELGVESKLVPKEYSEGIYVFADATEVGQDAMAVLHRDDTVLELSLTPNRADALSMIGVAYEVGAILNRPVKLPAPTYTEAAEKAADYINVTVEATEDNPIYIAKVIKDVKIEESPLWLQGRLMAAGIRPINNVVDITNYVLIEYGQPLHAFDYDRLGSKEILVRRAKDGEEIETLDGTKRTLKADHLVITNGTTPVALAGVMGGANSEVSETTTNILLEAAYFKGSTIRKSSKDNGLRSESSTRYEKGIDPNRARMAAERAAELLEQLAGGTVLAGDVEINNYEEVETKVEVTLTKINQVLGTNLTVEDVTAIFAKLQFPTVVEGENFIVTAPTRRQDITIPADLIEEVARMYGYDNLGSTLPTGATTQGHLTEYQAKRRAARRFMEGAGLTQTITYSLTSEAKATSLALEVREPVKLLMPMSEEHSTLRQSIVPNLLQVLKYNNARQSDSVAVYEVGNVFLKTSDTELPEHQEHIAGAITGLWANHPWQQVKTPVDFFILKGILEGLFAQFDLTSRVEYVKATREALHPGRTADVQLDGEVIGFIGQVHPTVEKEMDLKATYVFELNLEKVLNANVEALVYESIPRFFSVTRDIALVVDKSTAAGDIIKVIKEAGGKLLTNVSVFDLYEGERMEEGKKSLAYSLTYFDPEKTLTDEEIVKVHNKVLEAVKTKTGAVLRG